MMWRSKHPRTLQDFLDALGGSYNISLFHYRGLGGGTGRVLMGFECDNPQALEEIFNSIGYYAEKVTSPALNMFIQ